LYVTSGLNFTQNHRFEFAVIEGLAARNPKWVQFADRMWPELLVRHETAIAAIGEIRNGLLIDGVWVGEIGGVVNILP
jgi:hypothetical protein